MDFSDESELYEDDVHEIRPYMFEPRIEIQNQEAEQSESDSDSSDNSSDDSYIGNVDDWCECGCCVNMPSANERKCCQSTNIVDGKAEAEGVPCITLHEGFQVNCLNIHVLETSYYEFVHDHGPREENQEIHELYRYLAYRRFTRWVYGLLSKKCRRVIPACAVNAIRTQFPSEQYSGFQYPQ
ncbi:P2X purinoceptor 7-like [Ruditapes philippinarum]|uniref:P2X purinoceptor 7-like n=2 Tax=Ruditapes philippinarum TaxID=129788 RepID=UPI00295A5A78|nr:P2X purinoceptor 7-like [Ruditapes philippinarum]